MKNKSRPKKSKWIYIFSGLITVYIIRFGWLLYFLSLRGPFGLMGIFVILMPFLLIISIGIGIAIFILSVSYVHTQQKRTPVWVLVAMIIGLLLPCPIPTSPIPEVEHFALYRSDYEDFVEFIQDDLELPECRIGFAVPIQYQRISNAHCIFVLQNDESNLVIEFSPFDWYHPIHYVEDKDASTHFPCRYDGFVEVQIDDNWYVCQRDWN